MKERDFIITGLTSWDTPIGSNAIDIAKEIAAGNNRVLYVNSALDQMTLLKKHKKDEYNHRMEVLKNGKDPLRHEDDYLWVLDLPFILWSVNIFPDGSMFDFFNKVNNRKIFDFVRKTALQLGFSNFIHIIDNDIYRSFYSKDMLQPDLSVYYRRDNVQPFDYWKKHSARLEPLLINKSDLVVCNSPQLAEYARQFNPNSHDIGQGVDLSAYNTDIDFPLPKEYSSIPHPRIGYIGEISSKRLDADLVLELAKNRPDYSFVMVGGEDALFAAHGLHQQENVYFTGSISRQDVPVYMYHLDVCLNPQLLNEITMGNYPRKVDEYLAFGKPVIATHTATMHMFRKHVYLCTGATEFLTAIDTALQENDENIIRNRINFARSHSWKNNVDRLYRQIEKTELSRSDISLMPEEEQKVSN